jgi:hypothetical protein
VIGVEAHGQQAYAERLVAGDSFLAMIKRGYILPWLPESHRQTIPPTPTATKNATMSQDTCQRCPETSQGGAKGTRTPNPLLAKWRSGRL